MTIKDWRKSGSGDWENEETWKPEGEAELVGTLVGKSTVDTKHGPCVVLKIENEEGTIYNVWGSRAGIKKLIEEHDDELTLGREVGIRTKEPIKLKNGNDFVPYEMGFGGHTSIPANVPAASVVADDDEPF